jgi:hypothetical protein
MVRKLPYDFHPYRDLAAPYKLYAILRNVVGVEWLATAFELREYGVFPRTRPGPAADELMSAAIRAKIGLTAKGVHAGEFEIVDAKTGASVARLTLRPGYVLP